MNPVTHPIADGDLVAVTGGAGFIGASVVRALIGRGARVRVLSEPGRPTGNLAGLDVDVVEADIRDRGSVARAVQGARYCFHLAALYGFWPRDPSVFYEINVEGSRNVVLEASAAGVERICFTSTVATIGLQGTKDGGSAVEDDPARIEHLYGSYKRTKYVAEHEVLRLAAQGAPIVLVQPTFPVGPGDERPTPTGRVVLDYLNGRMPGFVETTFNVAHVDDLAMGHLLALERGGQGTSYICGGENLTMSELVGELASITGLPFPNRRFPGALAVAAGYVSDAVEGRLLRREPTVPLEGARMANSQMRFDDSRAREQLGYTSRPARSALEDSVRWFIHSDMAAGPRAETARTSLGI
jgi:dihydroflavonol-4-reductase